MLEEVKRVFSRFEVDFEATSAIGLDFLIVRAHIEHNLLRVAGLHVFLLNSPENKHVYR
jgi:hypothetical protein